MTTYKPAETERSVARQLQDKTDPEGLPSRIQAVKKEIHILQNKLDEPAKLHEAYKTQFAEWELGKQQIIGSAGTHGSLTYYQNLMNELARLPEDLDSLYGQRMTLVGEIYAKIHELVDRFRELYEPVQRYSQEYGLSDETFDLKFDVSIVDMELADKFFNWIAKNRVGSFYADGEAVLKKLLERFDFNRWADVQAFLDDLVAHLKYDQRQPDNPAIRVSEQLKRGQNVVSFYDYIFSLDYLRPRYILKLDEKELGQLSPGERGALLLVFYLLVDRDDIPLIIDQPEENLDNQTVYQRLVTAIKIAKDRRQILIVTHNPNLAVVCDAEQIVCCFIDKRIGNRIEYRSGAIENPEINAKIVDILEGTKPAFNNRRSKYAPFENLR